MPASGQSRSVRLPPTRRPWPWPPVPGSPRTFRPPSEERQVEAYRKVFETFPEGRVVVRVLDAGAVKPLDFPTPAHEPNPALGVRTLLAHPDVLHSQLRALATAASGLPAQLEVMAPMVADRATPRCSPMPAAKRACGRRWAPWPRSSRLPCGPRDPPGGRVPVAGHRRPRAVHLRRRSPGGRARPAAGPVAARPARPRRRSHRRLECRGQELRDVRRGCRRPTARLRAHRARCHQPVQGRRITVLRARRTGPVHPRPVPASSSCGALSGAEEPVRAAAGRH
jgi:hypothetical protein